MRSVFTPPKPVGEEPRGEARDDPAREHEREHLRAHRRAVAEVDAEGDDVDLRHRHRHAAGHAREGEEQLERAGREVDAAGGEGGCGFGGGGGRGGQAAAQEERAGKHDGRDGERDDHIGRAPALGFEDGGEEERPDRAGEVVAGGRDRHRDAAAAHEPVRDVGDEGAEEGGRAETEEDMGGGEKRDGGCGGREAEARRDEEGGGGERAGRAPAVDRAAHDEIARRETHHAERVGQGGAGAGGGEFGLDRRHHDDDRPHADVAHHREREGDAEPRPGIAAVVDASHAATLRRGAGAVERDLRQGDSGAGARMEQSGRNAGDRWEGDQAAVRGGSAARRAGDARNCRPLPGFRLKDPQPYSNSKPLSVTV
jgi:hypothetical protein